MGLVRDKEKMNWEIKNYVEKHSSFTTGELEDPETDLPTYKTIINHYGSLKECANELDLDLESPPQTLHGQYSREELIDAIKQNSEGEKAPKGIDLEISTNGSSPFKRVFGGYLNAVFMAGKKPVQGWFRDSKDHSDELSANYLQATRKNYWHNDKEDRWDTETPIDGRYLNPTYQDFDTEHLRKGRVDENLKLPNLRFEGGKGGGVDIQTQEKIMNIAVQSERYIDLVNKIEEANISELQVKKLLDPESENSYGRWMAEGEDGDPVTVERDGENVQVRAENEFPENSMTILRPRF